MYVGAALTIIGMAGLALDLGTVYLYKTRLQNAIDAAALDGAKTLDSGQSRATASTNATATFNTNINVNTGSSATLGGGSITFETSDTYTLWANPGTAPKFVRFTVANVNVPVHLISVFTSSGTMTISGSAVAGPEVKGGDLCGAIPIALCGDPGSTDKDCSDGTCYGITPGATGEVTIKDDTASGPGNYGLVQMGCGSGVNCVRQGLAGSEDTCFDSDPGAGNNISTQTGTASGPVADGLNTRFGQYSGPMSGTESTYKSDVVTSVVGPASLYPVYEAAIASHLWDNTSGVPERRVTLVPVIDCTGIGGHSSAPVLGAACMWLSRPAEGPPVQAVYGQLIANCRATGGTGGGGSGGGSGPTSIVLFQSSSTS